MEQQRKDPVAWQMDLLKKDYLLFDQLADTQRFQMTKTLQKLNLNTKVRCLLGLTL